MERMNLLDAAFLYVENDVTPMHIGGVAASHRPPPKHDELVSRFEAKLHLVPRYRLVPRHRQTGHPDRCERRRRRRTTGDAEARCEGGRTPPR